MVISRTPYRISFFGGGTDFPDWFRRHGGAVLATSIDKYCYLTCRYLPPFFEHRLRVVYSKVECCQSAGEVAHPVVREALRLLNLDRGLEIHHDGDLPARSGMGSSSSFTVGLLHALHALKGESIDRQNLAHEAIFLEQEILSEAVGCQDQVLATFGGLNHVVFDTSGSFAVRPVAVSRQRQDELTSHLMLFYTGIQRTSSQIAAGYMHRIAGNCRQLEAMGELVAEALAILKGTSSLREFGKLLHEAWLLKSSLNSSVTNGTVNAIYEDALSAGAIGGKLLGAGAGGFLLLFVNPDDQLRVRERLSSLLHVPFGLEQEGSRIIFHDVERDYVAEDLARSRLRLRPFCELSDMAA
ncbi:MAG: kinase [Planctomycetia bacterium]|nr:kinase [Planctomycetia bacterium]